MKYLSYCYRCPIKNKNIFQQITEFKRSYLMDGGYPVSTFCGSERVNNFEQKNLKENRNEEGNDKMRQKRGREKEEKMKKKKINKRQHIYADKVMDKVSRDALLYRQ